MWIRLVDLNPTRIQTLPATYGKGAGEQGCRPSRGHTFGRGRSALVPGHRVARFGSRTGSGTGCVCVCVCVRACTRVSVGVSHAGAPTRWRGGSEAGGQAECRAQAVRAVGSGSSNPSLLGREQAVRAVSTRPTVRPLVSTSQYTGSAGG